MRCWEICLLWHLLPKDLSVPYRHHSWGNESPQTLTQSQTIPVANQEKRQSSCLYCLLQGDAALPVATLREILICASCFLLSHCDSLLYIHCDRGKEIHYRFVAAVGPLPQSIYPSVSSCKTQGSWYLFTSWEEECPHPSGQIRCNFRERKSLGSTVLAKTRGMWEGGNPKVMTGQAKCSSNLTLPFRDYFCLLVVLHPMVLLSQIIWQTKRYISGTQKHSFSLLLRFA